MSQENVEMIPMIFEAWNRGADDHPALAEDLVTEPPAGWPEGEVLRDREAWIIQSTRLRDSWAKVRIEIQDVRAVDEERVVTSVRYIATGKESGLSFNTPMGAIQTLRQGKVVRQQFFNSPEEAFKAVGLST